MRSSGSLAYSAAVRQMIESGEDIDRVNERVFSAVDKEAPFGKELQ